MHPYLYLFEIIGIFIVWIINIPVYLFRLIMALIRRNPVPPVRSLFYVPKSFDQWLVVIGIVTMVIPIILEGYRIIR
jgi:hypothetical protein